MVYRSIASRVGVIERIRVRQASHTAVARGKGQLLLPRLEVLANAGVVACVRSPKARVVSDTRSFTSVFVELCVRRGRGRGGEGALTRESER